jgi:hypothetical protein
MRQAGPVPAVAWVCIVITKSVKSVKSVLALVGFRVAFYPRAKSVKSA